jgi:very-long-chain (3R)-3-hydroxyacyl-CoA dehydratase
LIQTYLLGYNIVSWSGWLYVLVLAISELVKTGGQWEGVFDATWSVLQVVQTAALFEVSIVSSCTPLLLTFLFKGLP